jgi:hypothetical protein
MSSGRSPRPGKLESLNERAGTVVLALILVSFVALISVIVGHLNDPPAPIGRVGPPGIASDEPTLPPELQHAMKEILRREAAQHYCNAHPEASSTDLCINGV